MTQPADARRVGPIGNWIQLMRICFVTNFIPPYRTTFYEKLCHGSPHDWLIVRGRVLGETGRPEYGGTLSFPIADVRNVERRCGPAMLRFQKGALAAVRAHRPDVVLLLGQVSALTNWLLLAWARLTGRRVVMWACGWEPEGKGRVSLAVKHWLMRLHFNRADRILLYSTKGGEYLARAGVKRELMTVCHNGIEVDHLLAEEPEIVRAAAELRQAQVTGNGLVFLYVGGLLADKRVDLLLDAFSRVRCRHHEAVLWIVGDGPEAAALKAQAAAAANSGVTFFGRIVEGVDKFFAAADVFVLPGIGGLAFNQAMFWRTPCVGSEADGTEDDLLLEGETGFRFKTGDPSSLEAAMEAAAALPAADRQAIGEAARRLIVERSNVSQMVQTFRRAIEALGPGA